MALVSLETEHKICWRAVPSFSLVREIEFSIFFLFSFLDLSLSYSSFNSL